KISPPQAPEIFIEIKSATLAENNIALFPDAVTARGSKHIQELTRLAQSGARAVIFIAVQRADAEIFSPADHIDPLWGQLLRKALKCGVELLAYRININLKTISLGPQLKVHL
ncbi:MAG: DNA/RNA nuclease SfsA, partial [Candidatus Adiutrix sp.]